ncbi:hypothetical protein B0H14DRAFT_3139854 [Mycena olivaceomarginata]|nr:hypothetical protein B0H14DRAFT_3139854 [Mycena olivaceomarginata]
MHCSRLAPTKALSQNLCVKIKHPINRTIPLNMILFTAWALVSLSVVASLSGATKPALCVAGKEGCPIALGIGPNGTDYSGTWIWTQPRNGSDICDSQSWLNGNFCANPFSLGSIGEMQGNYTIEGCGGADASDVEWRIPGELYGRGGQ